MTARQLPRRTCLAGLLACMIGVGAPAPARADCEDELKVLVPQVRLLTDEGVQRRADRLLVRALRELDEGDEVDCRPAADAVRAFLAKAAQR